MNTHDLGVFPEKFIKGLNDFLAKADVVEAVKKALRISGVIIESNEDQSCLTIQTVEELNQLITLLKSWENGS